MKKISIIGLGFVGLPTFLVLSNIKKKKYSYEVEGIEKDDAKGKKIKESFKKRKNGSRRRTKSIIIFLIYRLKENQYILVIIFIS